ncbi:hypothetical protein AMTR_s00007p00266000 [Amborella trichopoda]|uniref:Glycoside hydrolase family 3 C-terminal domain-containing protein n=1 Tax=Amborella trichopoda TaxID=13333 RepID=W1PCW9_AMBTC|nr:hypothetical protein AMTR_s00007p00266000 [Amborella trichopoda]
MLWAGYPSGEGGRAIADIIYGKYNPGGWLSLTWYYNDYISPSRVAKLGLPKYKWSSEVLHGVSNIGRGTHFDAKIAPGATCFPNVIFSTTAFNETLWKTIKEVVSTKARAMFNLGMPSLTYWSPNINVVRDPRWAASLRPLVGICTPLAVMPPTMWGDCRMSKALSRIYADDLDSRLPLALNIMQHMMLITSRALTVTTSMPRLLRETW